LEICFALGCFLFWHQPLATAVPSWYIFLSGRESSENRGSFGHQQTGVCENACHLLVNVEKELLSLRLLWVARGMGIVYFEQLRC